MKTRIALVLVIVLAATSVPALGTEGSTVQRYNPEMNYLREMWACASNGSSKAMQVGAVYEKQRNLKIQALGLPQKMTSYFTRYGSAEEILSAMNIDRMKSEHLAAGRVYEYLHMRGYSVPVIAGILGNMMAECGGQTLELDWDLYDGEGRYYGLCMWSIEYGPDVQGAEMNGQLAYLTGSIQKIMAQSGGDFDEFRSLQDAGAAARYFCTYYERAYGAKERAENAEKALAWLTGQG